jgi:hypothetical protein
MKDNIMKLCLCIPLPIQGLGASWEVEGKGVGWKVFEKSVFNISLTKTSMIIYTSPSVPLLEWRGKIIFNFFSPQSQCPHWD